MEIFLALLVIVLLILAIAGFAMISGQARKKQELQTRLQALPGFTPQRTLIKTGVSTAIPKGISIDPASQQICLIVGDTLRPGPFSTVIEAEIVIDGKTVTKTSRGSQAVGIAVGAALGGGLGAVIGGLSGSTTTSQQVRNVFLRLVLNNLDYPIHDVEFVATSPLF